MNVESTRALLSKVALFGAALAVALAVVFGLAGTAYAGPADDKVDMEKTYTATVNYKHITKDEPAAVQTNKTLDTNVSLNKDTDGTFRVRLPLTETSEKLGVKVFNEDGSEVPRLEASELEASGTKPFFEVAAPTLDSAIVIKVKASDSDPEEQVRVIVDANSIQAIPEEVNKQHLEVQIVQAEESADNTLVSVDGKDVDIDRYWTTSAVRETFVNAIAAAKVVYNDGSATQEQVDNAVNTLGAAISTFEGAKKKGTKDPATAVFKRLGGATAYETMDLIVRQGWKHSDRVIIATFDGFWDALSASSLAGLYDAPILVTGATELRPITAQLIKDLGAREAYIVGGSLAISNDVEAAVKDCLIGNKKVERYWGENAQETAIEVAKAKEAVYHSNVCIVATSFTYQDALAASPYAFDKRVPIFLTNADGKLTNKTVKAIKEGKYDKAVIVGGTAAVRFDTEKTLKEKAGVKEATRKWGDTAYETSFKFAQYALEQGMLANHMGVATINDYQDALTGGPLCGKNDGVLVLASNENTNNSELVKENKGKIATGYIFGGPVALDANVLKAFEDATK